MADLLEFHRRSEKPQWWEMFQRAELLVRRIARIGGRDRGLDARARHASDEYEYPPQEIKLEAGKNAVWLDHPEAREGQDRRNRRGAPADPARADAEGAAPLPDALEPRQGRALSRHHGAERRVAARRAEASSTATITTRHSRRTSKSARRRSRAAQPAQPIVADPSGAARRTSSRPCRRSTTVTCSSRGRRAQARRTPART